MYPFDACGLEHYVELIVASFSIFSIQKLKGRRVEISLFCLFFCRIEFMDKLGRQRVRLHLIMIVIKGLFADHYGSIHTTGTNSNQMTARLRTQTRTWFMPMWEHGHDDRPPCATLNIFAE